MILKGSQRSGPRQLAAHLMNDRDNDHVTVYELRGFASGSLNEAMTEAHAIAKGTRCRQPIFSLSLNPPKNADISVEGLVAAADRAEETLGLANQPRAIVIHEKEGRRHAHVVWSRIDANTMTATNLPFYKRRLQTLSKDLYLEHGWELPEGHRAYGWRNPLNFSLAEWQQAKRLDLDPREIKQIFQSAWARSDGYSGLANALEEHGFYLAEGNSRGVVAVNVYGEIFSLARWTGVKTKALKEKIGTPQLSGVDEVLSDLHKRLGDHLRSRLADDKRLKSERLKDPIDRLKAVVAQQRQERTGLKEQQAVRWRQESMDRASRFRRGLGIVMDILTGRWFSIRKQNEREAFEALIRDRDQLENLVAAQAREREPMQKELETIRRAQRQDRMRLLRTAAHVMRERRTITGMTKSAMRERRHEI